MPNALASLSPRSATIFGLGDGDGNPTSPGLIPSPISSDASGLFDRSLDGRLLGIALNPLLTTAIEWNVSHPVDRVRHALDDAAFIANVSEPATNPPISTLCVELHFFGYSGVTWNWDPITIRKRRPVQITDLFHAIYDYFQTPLTRGEYDIIKSHGKANAKIVRDSWRERVASQAVGAAQTAVYHGGLRRVDCLGSSKHFVRLWVDESQLKLGLRA